MNMYPVTLRGGLQVPTCAVGIVVLSTVDALVAARVLTLGCFLELSRNAAIGASGDDELGWKTKTGLFFANFHIHRSFFSTPCSASFGEGNAGYSGEETKRLEEASQVQLLAETKPWITLRIVAG